MRGLSFRLSLVLGALALLLFACSPPPPAATLTVSPTSATVTAGGSTQTFTATLTSSTTTISWALTGSGSLSTNSGGTTVYTPPANVAAQETATLTATAGALTASATITINPAVPSLTVSPSSATVTAGGSTQTFNATLTNSTDTINWSLAGNGSLSTNSGPTTVYTPPATVAATETATLTATAGALTASATITINTPASVTVNGSVKKFNGDPAVGINVQINDSNGAVLTTLSPEYNATDGSGNFTISNVVPPYTLSIIPPIGAEIPQTWENVNTTTPTAVINPFSGAASFCTTPAPGTINVTLTAPVGAGNFGQVIFIAEGINHLEINSNAFSAGIPAGGAAVAINVPFDPSLCQTVISGKLVYLERNIASNSIVNTGTQDVTVPTGNTVAAQITVLTGTTQSIAGNVTFPVGTVNGIVYLVLKVGGASALIEAQTVNTVNPNYNIATPVLPGVEYRSLVITTAFVGFEIQWAYSDVVTPPALGTNLSIPSLSSTISPAGAIGNNTRPDFRSVQINGTNLNYAYFEDTPFTGNSQWLGASQDTTISLPELPAPARLTAGTAAVPNNYLWAPLNSINVRAGGSSDTMLDGRQVKKLYFGFFALANPDVISAGSYNLNPTAFSIP